MIRTFYSRARSAAPALVFVAWAQLLLLGVTVILLAMDQRVLGGQPLWLKPAKFAASTALYTATLAWALWWLRDRSRAVRWISWGTAGVMVVEVALITLQAARGVSSHFNIGTPLDAAIYGTMGLGILAAWGLGVWATVLMFRTPFDSPAFGSALRAGMAITMIGAALGGAMTPPTAAQRAAMSSGERPLTSGAHSVGVEDGGPGLPGVGWSTEGGDLRVPHFFGLHAFQALPLAAVLLGAFARRRGLTARTEHQLIRVVNGTWMGLVAVLSLQALQGEPVHRPGTLTIAAAAAVLCATTMAGGWALHRARMTRPLATSSAVPPAVS